MAKPVKSGARAWVHRRVASGKDGRPVTAKPSARNETPAIWPRREPPVPRARLPRHIAIIMDGNGRWAKRHGWRRVRGHEAGAEAVRETVKYCGQIGISALTLFAFSTENWKRPRREVDVLMRLLKRYLAEECAELHANGVRLSGIGHIQTLPAAVQRELERVQTITAANRGLNLCLALNYGAQDEIADAARTLAGRVARGEIQPGQIGAELLAEQLHTRAMPPLELLIRTAGEHRLSNFLLWQACGALFHVSEACWPEFGCASLQAALADFAGHGASPEAPSE